MSTYILCRSTYLHMCWNTHWSTRMRKVIRSSLLFFLVISGIGGAAAQSPSNQPRATGMETDTAKIKEAMLGDWESIAPEVRPSASKNADGSLKPFYLKRAFKYLPSDRFELEIVNSADPYGAWAVNTPQSVFGKSFVPFALKEGTNFMEYDLVYLRGDMLFWGARNIDGRGFDTEQNRPTNLQIP